MLLGFDCFGTENNLIYETNNRLTNMYELELKNCIVDKLEIRTRTDIPFSTNKTEWDIDFIANGDFHGDLEAGNIDNGGVFVEHIIFKKRKTVDSQWVTAYVMDYTSAIRYYSYIDKLVQSNEEYEYAIVPMTANVEGEYTTATIDCSFDGTWICDKESGYKLFYNLEYGDIESVVPATAIETFNQYPTVIYGSSDYSKGNIKAVVMTDNDVDKGIISPKEERILRSNLIKFLKNRKPKILKDASGRFYIVSTLNARETPNNSVAQSIGSVSFDFIEVGDATSVDDLQNNNLG